MKAQFPKARRMKGERKFEAKSERGTGIIRGIRSYLVKPQVQNLKSSQTECNPSLYPAEEGNSEPCNSSAKVQIK